MADSRRRRPTTGNTFGNVAYDMGYAGDVIAAPMPDYVPQPQVADVPAEPRVTSRVREHTRVRAQVREQQAVAPFAVCGFLAVVAIAVVLLLGYIQLNSVYAETVELQSQLTELQTAGENLEARYEETFDMETLEEAVAADGTLSQPTSDQTIYIDLSEPDNAVVYDSQQGATGIAGFFQAVGSLLGYVVEYFR